jgi:hypothetical protein
MITTHDESAVSTTVNAWATVKAGTTMNARATVEERRFSAA